MINNQQQSFSDNKFKKLYSSMFEKIYSNGLIPYLTGQLYFDFYPDITGFTICLFVPPPLLGATEFVGLNDFKKLICFAAVDFSPPQLQIESERISSRSGGVPYVTEVTPTQQLNVTFIDNSSLIIYNYHLYWTHYIHNILEGYIEPPGEFINDPNSELYGGLDYAGSFYFVKFDPSFTEIKFVSKATGVFPQILPSKELIGQRSSNELATLPYSYTCAYYEETLDENHRIFKELESQLYWYYT